LNTWPSLVFTGVTTEVAAVMAPSNTAPDLGAAEES
jgi:hypothetical protein